MREIAYRVLTGEQGDAIRAALVQQHHFGRIAKALRRIHADLKADLDVETLAREAGMSLAVFHAQFARDGDVADAVREGGTPAPRG